MPVSKKICNLCEQVLDNNEDIFPKGKATCRLCYNKLYRQKYRIRKGQEKKETEIVSNAKNEYTVLLEENKQLKNKITELEKKLESIDGDEYDKNVEECKKSKENLAIVQKTLSQLLEIVNKGNE